MPSFRGLTAGERRLAITAVKRFYPGFASAHPTPVPLPEPPALDAAAVARGRQAYEAAGCASCHGDRGRGDGCRRRRRTGGWRRILDHEQWRRRGARWRDRETRRGKYRDSAGD